MIAVALLLAAANTPKTFEVMVTGPEAALEEFATAAKVCGYSDATTSAGPGTSKVVLIQAPLTFPSTGPWACTMEWMLQHPTLDLGFIGNAAREPL